MATWQQKLMTKQKRFELRNRVARFAVDAPKPIYTLAQRVDNASKSKALPRCDGWVPRAFGRKFNGPKLSHANRAMVELRCNKRAAFFAAVAKDI